MEDSLPPIEIALRVLTAITERRKPDAADVDALRKIAPAPNAMPLDELACEVIRIASKRRAKASGSAD